MTVVRAHSACIAPAVLALTATLSALLLFTSCGGGGGGGGTAPPRITILTSSLPEGTIAEPFHAALEVSGTTRTYRWELASGSGPLPPGLVLSSGGDLLGFPTEAGTYSFTVKVSDSGGSIATRDLVMHVREQLTVQTPSIPNGVVGRDFDFDFQAAGGLGPYSWSVNSGTLPPGLRLSSAGHLQGKPTTVGNFFTELKVQDTVGRIAYSNPYITIVPVLQVDTGFLPSINVGESVALLVYAQGGSQPYQWSLGPGSRPLPDGLVFSSSDGGGWGRVVGVATQPGEFDFTVQVEDSLNPPQIASRDLHLTVTNNLYMQGLNLPLGVVDRTYSSRVETFGGTLPYTWEIVTGTLPPGLSLGASTGEISGIPTAPTDYVTLQIKVTDSSSPAQTITAYFSLTINPPVALLPATFNDGIQTINYNNGYFSIQWGLPPYSLRITSGALPPGLALGPPYAYGFGGVPTDIGQFTFTVEVSDSASPPTTAEQAFSIRIVPLLQVLTDSLPHGWVGDPYTATLSAEGGVEPFHWYASSLPVGLTLNEATGVLSGTPKTRVSYSAWFDVWDSTQPPQHAHKLLGLSFSTRVAISSKLPAGKPDAPFRVTVGATGGTPPYSWVLLSGNLPEGLAFDPSTGLISGTPTVEGTSEFTVQVTDTGPPVQTVSRTLSLRITSDLGRNDDPATATPISNGTFRASISPFADPVAGPANPDHDFYELTATPGSVVTVETTAKRLFPESPIDTVLEIVDAAGNRFSTCRPNSYGSFDLPCLNDDIDQGVVQDSRLEFQVPESETGPVTFFVHVFSWDGNARPDYVYDLTVSGAN